MRICVDTNVLVSGLLRPGGPPAIIVRAIAEGAHHVCYDDRIIAEYRSVLARPKFGFDTAAVRDFLVQLQADGAPVACAALPVRLPDSDDEKFVEAALAGKADCLVTGNLRHFPPDSRCGVCVVSPREFLNL